jgi:hypothetical protein
VRLSRRSFLGGLLLLVSVGVTGAALLHPCGTRSWSDAIRWGVGSAEPRLLDVVQGTSNLGEGKPGDIKLGQLTLTNSYPAPVMFRVTGSCGCLSLEPREGRLTPGERGQVRVQIKLRRYGQDELVTLNVEATCGASQQNEKVRFAARCPAPLAAKPPVVDFGRLPRGSTARRTVQLVDRAGRPWLCGPIQVRSSHPHIKATLLNDPEGTKVQLSIADHTPPGCLFGEVLVAGLADDETTTIPVRGEVVSLVEHAPAALRFTSDRVRELTLMVWRNDGAPVGPVSAIGLPEGVAIRSLCDPSAKRARIAIVLTSETVLEAEARLLLRCDAAEGGLIEVPVYAER